MRKAIRFNGISTDDLGITVAEGNPGQPIPRIVVEKVPYRDGEYDFSRLDGVLHFDSRRPTYTFNIIGTDPEDAAERLSEVYAWLYSAGDGQLHDEHIPFWHFENVSVISTDEPEYLDMHRRMIRLKVQFSTSPYMMANNDHDPTITVPNSKITPVNYSSASYSADNKTANLIYQLPETGEAVMIRFKVISDYTASARAAGGRLEEQKTIDGYYYLVADKDVASVNIAFAFDTAIAETVITHSGNSFVADVYPEYYGRRRRL